MTKQVLISQKLFIDLLILTQDLKNGYFPDPDKLSDIDNRLNNKLDSLIKNQTFSRYKTAATADEQEAARKKYLEQLGIPDWL